MLDKKNDIIKNIKKISNKTSIILLSFLFGEVLVYSISSLILGILEEMIGFSLNEEYFAIVRDLRYFVLIPVLIFVLKYFYKDDMSFKFKKYFSKPKEPWTNIIKWIFIAYFIAQFINFITDFLIEYLKFGFELHPLKLFGNQVDLLSQIALYIFTGILAPIYEELIFRFGALGSSQKFGSWSMIISTSVLFGLYHMNYDQLFFAIAFGLCLGFLFIKTQSLWPPLILHIFVNMMSIVIRIFFIWGWSNIVTVLFFCLMLIGLILLIIEIITNRDAFKLPTQFKEISELRKIGIYFLSPITALTTVILLTWTIVNALG